tara:strand:- start:1 stop:1380 length:1380 start_codon:yes stop_codon:yes gene_type:complete
MGLFGAGDPPCPAGSICSGQAKTDVGKKTRAVGGTRTQILDKGTPIYHASATKLNSDGTSTTDVYIIKDNKWQKAATTKDGGKTYTYDDNVAGAGLKNELSDPNGAIHKNVDAGVNKAADKAGVPPTTKSNLLDSKKNDAENDNDDTQTKPAADQSSGSGGFAKPEGSAEGTRTEFPTIIHPADLGTSKQDVIRFDMHEYVPGELSGSDIGGGLQGFGFNSGTNNLGPSIGSVTLPIPSGISDQNKADWGSNSMTALDIAKADIAKTAIFEGLQEGATKFTDYIDKVRKNSGAVGSAVGTALAAAAAGVDGQALLSRTTGMVMNPNMELLFKGPTLRPFSFKFKLTPRGQKEADNIIQIIRFFKQGSAPIRSQSNLFLKSPHVFRITYIHRGEQGELHKKLNAFKTCALQGFGVNYTPTGNYATYQDGTMVAYDINMSFTEITPIFNDDYDMDDTFIGF